MDCYCLTQTKIKVMKLTAHLFFRKICRETIIKTCLLERQAKRIMKLTAIFLLAVCLQVSATGFSQKVTLSMKDAPLQKVFKEINRQTGLQFFYKDALLKQVGKVDIDVKNVPVEDVLKQCFDNHPVTYNLVDNSIVIKEKTDIQNTTSVGPPPPIKIHGRVVNENGEPVEGVTVMEKGTNNATSTDSNGEFILKGVGDDATLVFSGTNVETREVRFNYATTVNISIIKLKTKLEGMVNVMVNTGYQDISKESSVSSLQKISGEEIRKGITSSDVTSMLQGKVTGLYITNQNEGDPTSSGNIVMRGPSSIASIGVDKFNEYVLPTTIYSPLIVLDGVIMPSQTSPGTATSIKDVVNPDDIASLTILKDAAATAIYGSRAAAGVIVITTKKGNANGLHLTLDLKYGYNVPDRGNIRLLSGPELYNYQKIYFQENWNINSQYLINPSQGINGEQDYLNSVLPSLKQVQDSSFDYEKYGFLTSTTKEINLSTSGGNAKTRYYISAGYYNEQSTGIDNGLARKTFRVNIENTFNKHFSFNVSLNGIFDDGQRDNSSFTSSFFSIPPWVYPYNANGTAKPELDYTIGGYPATAPNFLFDKQYNYNTIRNQQLFGSLKIKYNITDWLSASTTNSFNLGYNKNENYTDARTYYGYAFGSNGGLSDNYSYYNSILTSNLLTFHKAWGDHAFSALAGQEFGTTVNETNGVFVNDIKPGYHVISLAQNIGDVYGDNTGIKLGNVNGDEFDQVMFSVFGELTYNYKRKYFISSSVRTDASTNFGRDKRYGNFYSVGAAWLLSNEDFLRGNHTISLLKLRANYGTSGSQNGNNFFTQSLYNPGLQYGGQSAAVIASLGNPDIGWETTQTLSMGADFGFLHNRITGNVDYYRRNSINLIQKVNLTAAIGFPSQYQNTGNVQNRGWEIMLNTENIKTKDFSWTTNFNISFNKNQLLKAFGDSLFTVNNGIPIYLHPGEDINTIKAIKEAGVDPQTGNPLYEKLIFDAKGKQIGVQLVQSLDSVVSLNDPRQLQTLGSIQPKFFGGMTNTFTYKNFSLSVLLYFQYGNMMFNNNKFEFQMFSVSRSNEIAYIKGQRLWTTPGQTNATEPSLYAQENSDWFNMYNSHFYDNGSYLRVRNVRLSYDLPHSLLNKLKIVHAEFYISGDNLFTFTHNGFLGSRYPRSYQWQLYQSD